MAKRWIKWLILCTTVLIAGNTFAQLQSCPVNISFSSGDLSLWAARTGLVNGNNQNYPAPNTGVTSIPEYTISTTGIRVITTPGTDLYGSFPTIPSINGYAYSYSLQIGSTATSWDLNSGSSNPGGFTRSVTYTINVPAGPASVPYTMTYAYALVLENGTHNSNQQPMFRATLNTPDSVITCASPQYYLPTFNNAGGGGTGSTGATLDTATAIANGFTLSPVLFLSHAGTGGNAGTLLQDVWTKGWTEVTFDLSAYRGQQVTLTFESLNCTPGAHFAYAYVALRNTCAGLQISGNPVACANSTFTYSIPSLAGATYSWTVPAGWTINSGANTNIITVTAGNAGGNIIAHEVNGCADLRDTLTVSVVPPTVAGQLNSNNTVCSGNNSTLLTLTGQTGNILNWISSTDGVNWTTIANMANSYTAQNLTTTTQFRARVQNGSACRIDTSTAAVITVDPRSVGGILSPANFSICAGQNANNTLTLTGNTGAVVNWQVSNDNTNWNNVIPVNTGSTYTVGAISSTTYYRTIVQSGVCPADTSATAVINFINVPFPQAGISPDSIAICYGRSAALNATISTGTSYTWSNAGTLAGQGNGTVSSLPHVINATATPLISTNYVLTVVNAGCPNALTDTFKVNVTQPIIVFAGNDTAVVANQPLQFNAIVNDPAANIFSWTPVTGLDFTTINNPVATLGAEIDYITYIVRATNAAGCYGEDDIRVTVFKTGPDIFVPSGFSPNGDGRNDIIYPICVGIKELKFFRMYNRWGQLIFSTSQIGKGWDGRISGTLQSSGNFVFMVQGVDYTGKIIFKKGNILLIR
ncbi:MAG: gliding motility-associated C-terminal domain-containing protein [Chitinophagaceae bacterium]|nr:gliding motility-associated C-terminal domain-containing protein [Chitinophagaceae bacterium]